MKRPKVGTFPTLRALNNPETLRLTVEVDLPQVKSNIEECKKALSAYSKLPNADPNIIEDDIAAWTSALE
jgi:hypothetical protein